MIGAWLLYAFMLGLLASFHCVGMCGPIAISLPIRGLALPQKVVGIFVYNIGRISTYMVLGLFFGIVGKQIYIGGWQQQFSIVLGLVIVAMSIRYLYWRAPLRLFFLQRIMNTVQTLMARNMQQKKITALFVIGLANGLLPCGMVYLGITGSLMAGSVIGGGVFMGVFGLGTLPTMFLLSYFSYLISISVRNKIKKAFPIVTLVVGILLVLRGMNLDIPFVSPLLGAGDGSIHCK